MTLAFSMVNCQSTARCFSFTRSDQAAISVCSVSISPTAYGWNNANQLISVKTYSSWSDYTSGATPTSEVDYGYDPFGDMVSRIVKNSSGTVTSNENFIYDGQSVALVLNGSGQVTQRNLYGAAVDQILASEAVAPVDSGAQAAGTIAWMFTDNQGTVRDVGQYNSGTSATSIVDHVILNSFGAITGQVASGTYTSGPPTSGALIFGMNGTLYDPVTGLNLMGARWYDPANGVWISQDPLGFNAGDTNLSRYVGNSPTNGTDPSGKSVDDGTWWAAGQAAAYQLFIGNTVDACNGFVSIANGQAGTALGNRAVQLVQAESGQQFQGTSDDWWDFAAAIIDGQDGANDFSAITGYDRLTGQPLNNDQIFDRTVGGGAKAVTLVATAVTPLAAQAIEAEAAASAEAAAGANTARAEQVGANVSTCFVAGTPVIVPALHCIACSNGNEQAELEDDQKNNTLIAATALLVAVAGIPFDNKRKKKRTDEDESMRAIFGVDDKVDGDSEASYPGLEAEDIDFNALALNRVRSAIVVLEGQHPKSAIADLTRIDAANALLNRPCVNRTAFGQFTDIESRDNAGKNAIALAPFRPSSRASAWRRPKHAWLALWLSIAALFVGRAVLPHNHSHLESPKIAGHSAHPGARPIEEIRVGNRVVAGSPDHPELAGRSDTKVDPKTWRLLRLHAEDRWGDGMLDTIEAETLQPQTWIDSENVRVGSTMPFPFDLTEMGISKDLCATVVAIEPCPKIDDSPGRVVLSTVNHLNPYVFTLQLRNSTGRTEAIQATGPHKFYSADRKQWTTVDNLRQGEHVPGVDGMLTVDSVVRFPGVHRVYNMTVEDEHVYHVAQLGALVHNEGCAGGPPVRGQGTPSTAGSVKPQAPTDPVKGGIYEFPDQQAGGKPYVGQSGNVPKRLAQHEAAGRLTPGTESSTQVAGGKTARELAEHNRIQQLTGGQRAANSPAVSNQRDPMGPIRRPRFGLPDPTE